MNDNLQILFLIHINTFQICCHHQSIFMQNYKNFHFSQPYFNMGNAFNSILSFELSQMCKSIEEELNTELLRNEFLKSRNYKTPANLSIKDQERTDAKQPVKKISLPMRYQIISKKQILECKIETKNLPKNFGKAIITYIQNNPSQIASYLSQFQISYKDFVGALIEKRPMLSTIESLRDLWLQEKFSYSKQMRELSINFLRKHCFKYIFNSRVRNMHGHIKYRKRLLQALERPHQFTSIKTLEYSWSNPNKKL